MRPVLLATVSAGLFLGLLGCPQDIAAARQGPARATAAPASWTVSGDVGLVFLAVRTEQTAAFEAALQAVKTGLVSSPKDMRVRQAAGWRVFRQVEPLRTAVVYLFVLQPPVRNADYAVTSILAEVLPDDVSVRPAYVAALVGQQTLLDLRVTHEFGAGVAEPPPVLSGVSAAPPTPTPARAGAAAPSRTFSGDLGLVLMSITRERLGGFVSVLDKLKTALQAPGDTERLRQSRSWRVAQLAPSAEAASGAGGPATVVFLIDPPVAGADYAVSRLVADAFPADRASILADYSTAFEGGIQWLNYTLVLDMRQ